MAVHIDFSLTISPVLSSHSWVLIMKQGNSENRLCYGMQMPPLFAKDSVDGVAEAIVIGFVSGVPMGIIIDSFTLVCRIFKEPLCL